MTAKAMKVRHDHDLRTALLRKTAALLEECGIQRPPVNLIRIARHVGIQHIRELDVRLDGQLFELDDGSYEVILSSQAPHTRRRFTLAHEIGHILVAAGGGDLVCSDGPTEELCNAVAAELLLPERFLSGSVPGRIGASTIRQTAASFQCSLEATGWRLLNMGLIKGVLLIWRECGPNSMEVSAAPRTYGFHAPFQIGDVLDADSRLMAEFDARDSGPIEFVEAVGGRAYTGDYVRLNKMVLLFLKTAESETAKSGVGLPKTWAQGELF